MRLPVGISWTNAVCVLLLVGLATRDAGAVCGNEEEHFLHRARSLVEEGEAGRALSVLRDGLESSPEEVQGWLLVGRILGELGGYEGAVEAYGRVARDLPLLGDCALLLRSDLALEQGRTADAESGYRDALREFPGSPHARRALLGLGRAASAEGHWRRAAEALDEFLARRGSKEETIEALQLLAAARLAEDDWLGAQAAYYELWKDHPGSEEAAMAAEALEFLRTTQGLVPPVLTPEQRFGRAERLRRAGSLNQAAAEFEKIVRSSPECELVPEAVYERGMIYFRLGENGRAMECLKSLVKRYPASGAAPDGLYLMARIHWRKGFRHRFLSACEDVLERYPDTRAAENAQFALGVFYMERNKRDKALAAFHGTISGDPSHSRRHDSLWKLGWLEYRDERFEEAFASFSLLATEATSGYRKASLYWSARCQEKLGNREEVEEILRRVAASYLGDHYGIQAGERLLAMGAGDIGDR
ncbi:MAG: tetratricopeptide repeat protein, partial [Candidatus Eisenbacteria sp.]|nr:tetratricopeptide repeat protein [Candidatus Eisenbacteria bacterium]